MTALLKNHELPKTIAGYDVLTILGYGAGSVVYEVSDPKTGQRYALKRVIKKQDSDQRFIDQLKTEYEIAKATRHRNLRSIYAFKKKNAWFKLQEAYLVMELLEGDHIADRRPQKLATLVKTFILVADALQVMQSAGYVHGDMKPQNIIITNDGKVRVIDLGQSCPAGTVKQRVQGTPDYIAPEQVKRRALTAQTDMFNFGATLYWCLTDRNVPTLIPKTDEHGRKIPAREKFHAPSHFRPDLPHALNQLVVDLLRTRPLDRPETWKNVRDRLYLIYAQLKRDQATIAKAKASQQINVQRRKQQRSGTGEIPAV